MKLVAKNYLFFGYFMYKYGSYPYISHALLFTKRQKKKKKQLSAPSELQRYCCP